LANGDLACVAARAGRRDDLVVAMLQRHFTNPVVNIAPRTHACLGDLGPGPTVRRSACNPASAKVQPDTLLHLAATTMVRLNRPQREALADTLRELANLAAAALSLGQFVGPQPLSLTTIVVGFSVWLALMGIFARLSLGIAPPTHIIATRVTSRGR
jgi:hypothetical protein